MTFPSRFGSDDGASNITEVSVSRLLRLGMSEPRRPVDALIERLRADDGEKWLDRMIDAPPAMFDVDLQGLLINEDGDLDDLVELKDRSKLLFKTAQDAATRDFGLFCYFMANAAALVQFGKSITSRSRPELDAIFADLNEVLPGRWRELCLQAALTAHDPG